MRNSNVIKSERGQILLVFALVVPLLILFTGLAVDAGILYVTKAKLSTAVDAACLTGMKNLSAGQTTAATLATQVFNANYGANPPTPAITFPTDAYGDQQVKVTATASVRTLFMQYLSQYATVPVGAVAVSTRGKLIMSVVLDRSGSMASDGGGTALQGAVPIFISGFSDATDEVAMISFSSNATIDRAIDYNFTTPINNKVAAMNFSGGTFGTGAGTQPIQSTTIGAPLSLAQLQNDSIVIQPNQNVVKVVVYFTDGLMNAAQDKFYCGGKLGNPANTTLVNYGGYDSGTTQVGFLDPTQPLNIWGNCNAGGDNCASGLVYDGAGDICKDISGNTVTKFVSQQNGATFLTRVNVTAEAQYRARITARALRTESPVPTYIYTIGLGAGVSPTTQAFLAELANDPAYPATFVAGQPAGEFFNVPNCPSANCTSELTTAFQTIKSKVLLRLTQ